MSDKDFDILVVAEINPDIILSGNVEPNFSQVETLIGDYSLTIGSSGAIFACGASLLGLRVAFLGVVGDDPFGHFMLNSLNSYGIDVSGCIIDQSQKTGMSVILSRGEDRAILTYTGTIQALQAKDIDRDFFKRARHIHISSCFLQEALRPDLPELLEEAHRFGMSVSVDTNFDPKNEWNHNIKSILSKTDIFFPNEHEACAISQQSNIEDALSVLTQIIPVVVVKRGGLGATVQKKDKQFFCEAFPVNLVDTTGAGDSFNAGFLYGYLHSFSLENSLWLGCACGALSTRSLGGTDSQPTLREAVDFLSKHGLDLPDVDEQK